MKKPEIPNRVIIEERTKNCVGATYGSVKENLEWLAQKATDDCHREDLRQFVEWGNKPVMCKHLAYYHRRKNCVRCWQELEAQLEQEGIED